MTQHRIPEPARSTLFEVLFKVQRLYAQKRGDEVSRVMQQYTQAPAWQDVKIACEQAGLGGPYLMDYLALQDEVKAEILKPTPDTHEYAFDCTLVCVIRVRAESKEAAAALVREHVDAASANLGAWPDGTPIVCEVSVEGALDLFEIDGEAAGDGEPL